MSERKSGFCWHGTQSPDIATKYSVPFSKSSHTRFLNALLQRFFQTPMTAKFLGFRTWHC